MNKQGSDWLNEQIDGWVGVCTDWLMDAMNAKCKNSHKYSFSIISSYLFAAELMWRFYVRVAQRDILH